MIRYFGENFEREKCDKHCDNCAGRELEAIDITDHAKALANICQELEKQEERATLLQVTK